MPPKPRQVRIESKSAMNAMQQLEQRSDEELEKETRFKSAAQAILGTRAAERMDAEQARVHFRSAIAAARPQERLQLRRMAEASLALAERRPGDLKAATEKLGGTPPTNRQLLMLRVMGIIAPPKSAGLPRRIGGILLVLLFIVLVITVGFLIVKLIALPFGGIGNTAWFWGFLLVLVVLGVLAFVGRRRQADGAGQDGRATRVDVRRQQAALAASHSRRHDRWNGCAATVLVPRRSPRRRAARPRSSPERRRGRGRPAGRAAARAAGVSEAPPRRSSAGVAVPRHHHHRDRSPPPRAARGARRTSRRWWPCTTPDDDFEGLIAPLNETAQVALRLRFVDDLDYDGIAERLGCYVRRGAPARVDRRSHPPGELRMSPLPESLLESVAAAAVREGLADALYTRLYDADRPAARRRPGPRAWCGSRSRARPRTWRWPRSPRRSARA